MIIRREIDPRKLKKEHQFSDDECYFSRQNALEFMLNFPDFRPSVTHF